MTDDTPLDAWLRILANEQRRAVLTHLRREGETTVTELAQCAAVSGAKGFDGPTRPEIDRALTALVHVHLPLLDDWGIIDWRRDDGLVSPGDIPEYTPVSD